MEVKLDFFEVKEMSDIDWLNQVPCITSYEFVRYLKIKPTSLTTLLLNNYADMYMFTLYL